MKILLDTDIGTDCDDVVCLAYLLLRDDCELLGVTTVGREAATRAAIARRICAHFGREAVPVVAGASRPMLPNRYWWGHRVNQDGILDAPVDEDDPAPIEAVAFLREIIHRHPDEVVLVTVGPATNAGLLATADPAAFARLKGVYSMGGRVQPPGEEPQGECNAMLDPAAFSALLTTPTPYHLVAGVEVTGGTSLDPQQVATIFAGGRLAIVRDCIRACAIAFKKPDPEAAGTGMHDPLTAACAFHAAFCTTRRGRMSVTFQHHAFGERAAFEPGQVTGYTPFAPDDAGPHHLATAADVPAFHRHVAEAFATAR